MHIIELDKVWKVYKTGNYVVYALKDVSICVEESTFHCIVGPSGSGKSTLLYIIGGLERPSKGVVKVCGQVLNKLSEDELARFRNRNIGFVFQQFYLIPRMTVLENVELPLVLQGVPRNVRHRLAKEALKLVGLEGFENRRPSELSGGEQQRVAIARAIVHKPKIVLADEPTGNLDIDNARKIMDIFKTLNKELGITVVLVTHNIEILHYCDRITRLRSGEVIAEYSRDEISKLVEELLKSSEFHRPRTS